MGGSPATCGVYVIRCSVTGRVYVGSSVNIGRRWTWHLRALRDGCHHSRKLQRAWIKYGADAFAFEIVESVSDQSHLIVREQHWLDSLRGYVAGFNCRPIAESPLGTKHTAEWKARMSAIFTGRKLPPRSAAQRQRMSEIKNGISWGHHSVESKEKIRMAQAGRKRPSWGRHTAEARQKMSLARIGWVPSGETRRRMSVSASKRRGVRMSAATKAKLLTLNLGVCRSEETRRKLREAWVRRKARATTALILAPA